MLRKLILVAAVATAALGLAGCNHTRSVLAGGTSFTALIENPVGPVGVQRLKLGYAAVLRAAADWRAYCWSRSYASLMRDPLSRVACENRRERLRMIQAQRPKAGAAVRAVDKFVRENPTLSAVSALGAAWTAVNDFSAAIPTR